MHRLLETMFQEGHTKLSCKVAKAEAQPQKVTEDDKLFWSYVIQEERPTTLYHVENGEDEAEEGSTAPEESDGDGEDSFDLDDMYI